MKTVSVIVPVYNVEPYLLRCLDSIAAQTYSDLEVILVDDGSTDASGSICDGYCLKDTRFRVVHQENKWLAEARNTGLREAGGEYVYFVDSDDFIHPGAIGSMVEALEASGCDIAFGDYQELGNDDAFSFPDHSTVDREVWPVGKYLHHLALQDQYRIQVSVAWNKLIPRRLVEDLRFPSFFGNEDTPFSLQLFRRAGSVVFVKTPLYYYCDHYGSITRSDDGGRKAYYRMEAFRYNLDSLPLEETELRSLVLRRLYMTLLISRYTLEGTEWESKAKALSDDILKATANEFRHSPDIPWREKAAFRILWRCPFIMSSTLKLKGN